MKRNKYQKIKKKKQLFEKERIMKRNGNEKVGDKHNNFRMSTLILVAKYFTERKSL